MTEITTEVYYTTHDPDKDGFETARDIRCYADPDDVTPEIFAQAYDLTCEGETSTEQLSFGPEDTTKLLRHIYDRLQGPRRDKHLGYIGGKMRSCMVGDIIVINGIAHMVDRIGFEEMGEFEELQTETSEATQ